MKQLLSIAIAAIALVSKGASGSYYDSRAEESLSKKEALELLCPTLEEEPCSCRTFRYQTSFSDMDEKIKIDSVHVGHFSSPSRLEAIVITEGCEPHVSLWGGYVLFKYRNGEWHPTEYKTPRPGTKCATLPARSGKNYLLCEYRDMHQGYVSSGIWLYKLQNRRLKSIQTVYEGGSNEGMDEAGGNLYDNTIKSWRLKDLNGDSLPDLRLYVHDGRYTKTIDYIYNGRRFHRISAPLPKPDSNFNDDTGENLPIVSGNSHSQMKQKVFRRNGITITLKYPKAIESGSYFKITAIMRNNGRSARMGGLTLSFPQLQRLGGKIVSKKFDSVKGYEPPAVMYSSIYERNVRIKYFAIEGWENRWSSGTRRYMKLLLRAPNLPSGTLLKVNVRGVLVYGRGRNRYEKLIPTDSDYFDQQGYPVYRIYIRIK